MSSQQYYSLLSLMINDTEGVMSGVTKCCMTEKGGVVYDVNGKPCNGFYTDYYDEDKKNVRVSGRFKNGLPVGMVRGYYKSGTVKFRYVPYKKKYKYYGQKYNYCLYKEYDESGNCIRYTDDTRGVEKRYDANGSLLSVLYYSRKGSELKHYEEYCIEGRKIVEISDGNRFDYDESGQLRRHWVRKSEKYDNKSRMMAATFYFKEYDVSGDISRSGRFYTNLYEHDRWLHISPEFPISIEHVSSQDFKEIVYPRLGIKDVYRWNYVNNKTIIIRYKQRGSAWIETERKTLPRLRSNE